MIKASAGGGGKGMRIAHNDEEARSVWDVLTNYIQWSLLIYSHLFIYLHYQD